MARPVRTADRTADRVADRPADRRLGWLLILAGAAIALAVQVAQPVGVPLYDGVVVQEPYRFLHPTGDQTGTPTSYTGQKPVSNGPSPIFAAATTENPPQAQLISQRNAFEVTPGATAVLVSVTPIEPPGPPPEGSTIAGNVYRFSVTDQSGTPLDVRQCAGCLSLLLRAPAETEAAAIKRFADGAWQNVETVHAGMVDLYQTNATAMGDYAVIATNLEVPGEGMIFGVDQLVAVGGGIVIVLLLIAAFLLLRVKQAPPEPEPAPRPRIPSKKKGRR
jgi:hypothetical protein